MAFRNHRFSRLELLVGRQALNDFRDKHVMVVGLGGVGSWAAEALARSAVGHLTLVDHDEVCVTNVNRQIHAFGDTVGKQKTDLMVERLKRINPHLVVSGIMEHHHPDKEDKIFEEAERLAGQPVDAVLDCIDTVVPKADLLVRCYRKKIKVISAMGSASRMDPSLIRVGDISKTKEDPLAREVRNRLKTMGITSGIRCVFSTEKPVVPEQSVSGTEWKCICPNVIKEFGACTHKRVMLGQVSYLPPMFGMWMVSDLVKYWTREVDFKAREKMPKLPNFEELQRVMNIEAPGGKPD